MSRKIKINDGEEQISMPDGNVYDGPVEITLSDDDFARLAPHVLANIITDMGPGPGSGGDSSAGAVAVTSGGYTPGKPYSPTDAAEWNGHLYLRDPMAPTARPAATAADALEARFDYYGGPTFTYKVQWAGGPLPLLFPPFTGPDQSVTGQVFRMLTDKRIRSLGEADNAYHVVLDNGQNYRMGARGANGDYDNSGDYGPPPTYTFGPATGNLAAGVYYLYTDSYTSADFTSYTLVPTLPAGMTFAYADENSAPALPLVFERSISDVNVADAGLYMVYRATQTFDANIMPKGNRPGDSYLLSGNDTVFGPQVVIPTSADVATTSLYSSPFASQAISNPGQVTLPAGGRLIVNGVGVLVNGVGLSGGFDYETYARITDATTDPNAVKIAAAGKPDAPTAVGADPTLTRAGWRLLVPEQKYAVAGHPGTYKPYVPPTPAEIAAGVVPIPEVVPPTVSVSLAPVPAIQAQPALSFGREIHRLPVVGNKVYLTYGDYGADTGPLRMLSVTDTAPTTIVDEFPLLGEESWSVHEFGDGITYVPNIDPRGGPGEPYNGQYLKRSAAGVWTNVQNLGGDAVHIFDLAKHPTDGLFIFGCGNLPVGDGNGGSTIWRTTDGGATHSIVYAPRPDPTNYERFVSAWVLGNDLFAWMNSSRAAVGGVYRWDGTTFTKTGADQSAYVAESMPFTIKGVPVALTRGTGIIQGYATPSSVNFHARVQDAAILPGLRANRPATRTYCMTKDGTNAYTLGEDMVVRRLDNQGMWTPIVKVAQPLVRSIAVLNGYLYSGTTDGQFGRVALPA